MKNTGTCPKCGGTDIVRVLSSLRPGCDGSSIRTDDLFPSQIRVPRYVCCTCGYAEEWIDPQHLPKLKKDFGCTSPSGKISPFE